MSQLSQPSTEGKKEGRKIKEVKRGNEGDGDGKKRKGGRKQER
jgi:hypothetical protein